MRRRSILSAVLVGALAFAVATGGPAEAKPAPKAYPHYFAIAGSKTHLLYSRSVTSHAVTSPTAKAPRYVLDRRHHSVRVPTGWSASLLGDRPLLTRTATVDGVRSVRWRLPESHRSGTTPLPAKGTVVAPAPNGWVSSVAQGAVGENNGPVVRLVRTTTSGASTELGVPYSNGAPFALAASDKGLLAYSYPGDGGDAVPDSTVKYMAWSAPGTWRTLYPRSGTTDGSVYDIQCGLSSALASCWIEHPTKLLLLPLSASKPSAALTGKATACTQAPVSLSASAVWTVSSTNRAAHCQAGRLERFTTSGKLVRSTRTYARYQQPVVAFDRLVVASKTQRTLYTLTGVRSTPKHLIGR